MVLFAGQEGLSVSSLWMPLLASGRRTVGQSLLGHTEQACQATVERAGRAARRRAWESSAGVNEGVVGAMASSLVNWDWLRGEPGEPTKLTSSKEGS